MTNQNNCWTVYIHTNKINNKVYIGITSRNVEQRWGNNGNLYCLGNQPVFERAIKKYGWNNFEHIIFREELSEYEAKHTEKLLIALYKSNCNRYSNPSYGYNETDGGDGSYGYKHTDKSKFKMSELKKGKNGSEANSSKAVYCIELDKIFANARIASEETGVSYKFISNCLRAKAKSTHGGNTNIDKLHWIFNKDASLENINLIINRPAVEREHNKVYCIELNKVFDSAQQAEDEGFAYKNGIYACCSGNNKCTLRNGIQLHWIYEKDISDETIQNALNAYGETLPKKVYCPELDMIFSSITEANKYIGSKSVGSVIRGVTKTSGRHPITNEKLHWQLVN